MTLLHPAEKDVAYMKAGLLGFAGSGKTYTACMLAAGISHQLGKKRPVAFFDTEAGSGYMVEKFRKANIELLVAKTRAFSDLLEVVSEAERTCDVLVIDSITPVWTELQDAYLAQLNAAMERSNRRKIQRLEFQHWRDIKTTWRRFTDAYLNSQLHIIMCGRAGWEYEFQLNEETQKKELVKGDIKMKAEGEMGYEPSLLLEMERFFDESGLMQHRCIVLKDRFDLLNGKEFINPTFKSFTPIWEALNIGGTHAGINTTRTSEGLFDAPDVETDERRLQRRILNEEIQGMLVSALPGQTAKEKKWRADLLQVACGTRSESKMEMMKPDDLRQARETLQYLLFRYAQANEGEQEMPADFVSWLEQRKAEGTKEKKAI